MRLPHSQLDKSSNFNSADHASKNARLRSLRRRKGNSSWNVGESVDDVEDIVDSNDDVNGEEFCDDEHVEYKIKGE